MTEPLKPNEPIAPKDEHVRNRMEQFYRTSKAYMTHLHGHNEAYFRRYITLVKTHAPTDATILDLGCGTGLSSRLLSDEGYNVVGADISPLFLQDTHHIENNPRLKYRVCNALNLPFKDEAFDVVSSHQLIEHLPNVETALREMLRVVRIGGLIIIKSPNLCSPITPTIDLLRLVHGKSKPSIWSQTKQQAIYNMAKNSKIHLLKKFSIHTDYIYRVPDLDDTTGGDRDSVYYSHPLDLIRFFDAHGASVVQKCYAFGGILNTIMAKCFPLLSTYISTVAKKETR